MKHKKFTVSTSLFKKCTSYIVHRTLYFFRIIPLYLIPLYLLSSCGEGNDEEQMDKRLQARIDSNNLVLGVSGKVFVIPSSIQTSILIQKSGVPYNKDMLNTVDKANSYSTKFQKCLNLGIYGADLGYTTLYNQTQDAMAYFKITNNIASDLGLTGAFDKNLIERFQKNIGNKDSMLTLVSAAYRASNDFLKNNERDEEAALIIAGGWIETLQFAVNVMKVKANEDVKRRIAEQKNTLNNLISLLAAYQGNEEYAELLQKLNGLKTEYDLVKYKYIYERPITDETNKTTHLTSKSEITITPENIEAIGKIVAEIRGLIIA